MKSFQVETKVIFGEGALACLEELCDKSVCIVTDKFLSKNGVVEQITSHMKRCLITVFDEVVPDPPVEVVTAGVAKLRTSHANVLIAVGGGSSIDTAKAVYSVFSRISGMEQEIVFYAIPTTSGSGSEVTSVAVITDLKSGIKYPLAGEELCPHVAILDPALVSTVPQSVTADTGMDALTHALEAYVAAGATEFTDAWAEKTVELVFAHLLKAYQNGNNFEAREKMHTASCMAGMALDAAGLGAAHGLAHALGGKFHLPHGRLNAILLPAVMRFNAGIEGRRAAECEAVALKYQKLAQKLGYAAYNPRSGTVALIRAIEQLNRALGIPATLHQAGVDRKMLGHVKDDIIAHALSDATTSFNPIPLTEKDIGLLLQKVQ